MINVLTKLLRSRQFWPRPLFQGNILPDLSLMREPVPVTSVTDVTMVGVVTMTIVTDLVLVHLSSQGRMIGETPRTRTSIPTEIRRSLVEGRIPVTTRSRLFSSVYFIRYQTFLFFLEVTFHSIFNLVNYLNVSQE